MMYEAYEKKVRQYVRHAKIFKICIQCLVALCVLAAILTLGYFSLRGIHFGSFEQQDHMVAFGEKPDYGGFILFGTYRCEYAPLGSEEWSEEQPIIPGEYRVRGVITKGFFGKVYSEPGTVELYRRQITLFPSQIFGKSVPYGEQAEYGEHWNVSSSVLAKGHKVKKAALSSQTLDGAGGLTVRLDVSSLVIEDSRGRDVTDCYIIDAGYTTLDVKKVQLTVAVANELKGKNPVALTKQYDGTPLYTNNYFITKGDMVGGDVLIVTTPNPRSDVGKGSNDVQILVRSSSGENRTAYYQIKQDLCRVEITERPITITTYDQTLVYNGAVQFGSDYGITKGSLVSGHSSAIVTPSSAGVTDVTEKPANNKIVLAIYENGRDVTRNYDITYEYGDLNVLPLTLRLRTQDSSGLIYNGQAQSATGYSIVSGNFAPGHSAVATSSATLVEPGSCENSVEYKIVDAKGKNVTKNYQLSVEYGTLTVAKGAPLSLALQSLTKTYDASPLDPADYAAKELYTVVGGKLCGSDYIEITGTSGKLTDVGVGTYSVQYRIMHKNAKGKTEDATSWYTASDGMQGSLQVTPRTVTLTFDAINKQYDGAAAVPGTPRISDTALSSFEGVGHKVVIASGAMQNLVYSHGGIYATDIGNYTYTIPEQYISVVLDNGSGADRTHNYQFVYKNNTIRIDGIALTLRAPSASKEYDGTPLSADRFSYSDVGVDWSGVSGYTVSFTLTGSQTDAGTGTLGFADIQVTNRQGQIVTQNFKIKTVTGQLTVTPIWLRVQSSSGRKVYDGLAMENATQLTLLEGRLVAGHVLSGTVNGTYITDVGTHTNDRITPKVYSAMGQDVTKNYKFDMEAGSYTVTPCPLYIGQPSVTGEYTGAPYEGACDATGSAQGLARGHRVELDVYSDGISLGVHTMRTVGCRILDARNRDVTENYILDYTDGTIEIVQRKISVITGGNIVEYGKGVAVNTDFNVRGSGLIQGHSAYVEFTYPDGISDVGTVDNAVNSVRILDERGRDVTYLYNLSYQYGTLCVKPISITVRTDSAEKETYDGQPIVAPAITVTKGEVLAGHRIIPTHKYAQGVADVGKWANDLLDVQIVDRNGKDVSYLYDVTVDAGYLHIKTPYKVMLTTESACKIYDGTPLEQLQYTVQTELLPGHTIVGVNPVQLTEVGFMQNRLTLIIHDAQGNDVSKNYAFAYDVEAGGLGELEILPRELSVTLGHVELTYTGEIELFIYENNMTYQGLVPGERIRVRVRVESPEIGGKREIELIDLRVFTAGGREVTHCYNDTLDTLNLSVTVVPAELQLSLSDRFSKEYDGMGIGVTDVGYRVLGLASGHRVEYSANTTPAEPGSYTLSFTEWAVLDREGNDVTANYTVLADSCQVTIYKMYIKLTSKSASRHYNGEPLFCHELEKYTLPDGYWLDVEFLHEQLWPGKVDNVFEVKVYDPNGNIITDYCNLSLQYGELEVWDQIELTLSSGSALGIFNNQPLICHEISEYTLPDGYWMEVFFTGEQMLPGESDNVFYVYIYDPDGHDVTVSFAITYEFGTLTVLEKASDYVLTLKSESASKQYDGNPLTCPELVQDYVLPDGFVLDVKFTGSQTNMGASENTFAARAYNDRGDELTIVYEFGTLEVHLQLTVNAYEMTYTYDGTEKNCENFWVQGLPSDDYRVEVEFGEGLTHTGSKDVEFKSVRVYDSDGNDITELCSIKTNTAKLTVLPRTLTVYVYGQSADSIVPSQGSLVEGHTMFAEYGDNGECYIEIADRNGMLVYSNRGDSPINYVLYEVNIQYG